MVHLTEEFVSRVVHPRPLNGLANAVSIGIALGVALEDVVAHAADAAARQALEVVVANVVLCLVSMQARPRVHT